MDEIQKQSLVMEETTKGNVGTSGARWMLARMPGSLSAEVAPPGLLATVAQAMHIPYNHSGSAVAVFRNTVWLPSNKNIAP